MSQPGQQPVYFRAFQFVVEIDGVSNARFQDVGGVDATTDVIEYREGGDILGVRAVIAVLIRSPRVEEDQDLLWRHPSLEGGRLRVASRDAKEPGGENEPADE